MSKELEAFRDILGILSAFSGCEVDMNSERIKLVNQALQRLEQIDKAKPGEALKDFESYSKINMAYLKKIDNLDDWNKLHKLHKQVENYILKAQEQEKENNNLKGQVKYLTEVVTEFQKILKVIFEKNVSIFLQLKSTTLLVVSEMLLQQF